MGRLLTGFSSQAFMQLLDFQLVFFFQFLQTEISGGFVVAHVVVPRSRELKEL